jgi:ADP-ribose pyrophosphatase YjhB (NUDIX family)
MKRCCENCGHPWPTQTFPQTCLACHTPAWQNPLPVIVALITTTHPSTLTTHILLGVRAIPPQIGHPALFSGYMETTKPSPPRTTEWKQEAIREVYEETSGLILLQPEQLQPLAAFPFANSASVPGVFTAFCHAHIPWPNLTNWTPNEEVSQLLLPPLTNTPPLAFSTHEEAVTRFRMLPPPENPPRGTP